MNQETELRKEITFYEQVMTCSNRKLVKDAARGKKEEIEKQLMELVSNGQKSKLE